MSINITDETVATLTIEGSAKSIAKGIANIGGNAEACKHAYLANRAGLSLEKLAKATTALLAANPAAEKKSVSKAAMEQRVAAYSFLQDNSLSTLPQTVGLAYTLAAKPTKAEEFARVLANYSDPTNKKTLDVLIGEAIKRANAAIKAKKSGTPNEGEGEGSDEGKADNAEAASILKDTAGQITAYLRAQSTRKFSKKDAAMILKALGEFSATLSV